MYATLSADDSNTIKPMLQATLTCAVFSATQADDGVMSAFSLAKQTQFNLVLAAVNQVLV
ncbi:hypothetical protein ACFOD0_11005 [Shewanella intestini]|uniref:Uncharacterized protein n=1 Tax=Shewanella intestini TaxID=2017544 RepID=A0ABS5I216_9GAMM|nr:MULTISPECIES: hypothetical protein [Shewanella]MBR9728071.1 hypothetical protein [Shewanella intestini]MRG36543.1 hypothetical protein [Shewanella sp. XMDDZSB0408]